MTDAALIKTLEDRLAFLKTENNKLRFTPGCLLNQAFMFIKPAALTPGVVTMVKAGLAAKGISVVSEGELDAKTIDEKKLIDTHYGAIAQKAMVLKPHQLSPSDKSQAAFQKMFGIEWSKAAADGGNMYNAADLCTKLGIDGEELENRWRKLEKDVNLIKLGGGFYCGKLGDDYVINAFYMSMRSVFTTPPAKINYFVVEWAPGTLSWGDFREKVVGSTDPSQADPTSLRGQLFAQWESLGCAAAPNGGDNGVHGSASPLEGLAERMNWVSADAKQDAFGQAVLGMGVSQEQLCEWAADCQVELGGEKGSVFDFLEDTDAVDCLGKMKEIHGQ